MTTMERIYRAIVLALYQLSLLMGILMMPVALLTKKLGLRLPIDRVVLGLKGKYERTNAS